MKRLLKLFTITITVILILGLINYLSENLENLEISNELALYGVGGFFAVVFASGIFAVVRNKIKHIKFINPKK